MFLVSEGVILDNLVELLLTAVLTFNIAAYSYLWRRAVSIEEETEKNSETISMLLNRIFGLDKDPTDHGHIVETETRFDELDNKLDDIDSKLDDNKKERVEEYRDLHGDLQYLVRKLSEEPGVDIEKEAFEFGD